MSDNINSNVGAPGANERPGERWYRNAVQFGDDANSLLETFTADIQEAAARDLTRTVLRQIVSPRVLEAIQRSDFAPNLEVAVPVDSFVTHPNDNHMHDNWLIYLAANADHRQPLRSDSQMMEDAEQAEDLYNSRAFQRLAPTDRIAAIRARGFEFMTAFAADDTQQVSDLWDPVFENWDPGTVGNLRDLLAREQDTEPSERSVWFSGLRVGPTIVSLAMGEALTLETSHGPIDLIETTEWLTRSGDEFRGHHLMSTNLTLLNAQIAHDLNRPPGNTPLIFAECNDSSSSYRAGFAAGLAIPERTPDTAPQIIHQNVRVGDSEEPQDSYRDFHFVRVPATTYATTYHRDNTAQMLRAAAIGGM